MKYPLHALPSDYDFNYNCLLLIQVLFSSFNAIFDVLIGQKVVIVRCEGINISGSFYRNKCKTKTQLLLNY